MNVYMLVHDLYVCVCGLSVRPPMAGPSAPCLPVTSGSPRRGQ